MSEENGNEAKTDEPKKARRAKRTLEERKADAKRELEDIAQKEIAALRTQHEAAFLAVWGLHASAKALGKSEFAAEVLKVHETLRTLKL